MAKPFSLSLLQELSQDKVDEATRQLGKLVQEEQQTRERLALIEGYRNEYLEKFKSAQAEGLTPRDWQNYQSFLSKLDEAVAQQTQIVASAARRTALGQQQWQAHHRKSKALDTLADRHQQREQLAENRAEQKLLDEFTTRRFPPEH